jgi:hypothetical protein
MRKLLLASAAAIGATTGMLGVALAQEPLAAPQAQTVLATPPLKTLVVPNNGNAANSNNNYQAAMLPGAVANPVPGSFVIRLNGGIWTEFDFTGSNANSTLAGKINTQSLVTYFRLYPGFDAMAANGLRYGGQAEIRENFVGNATSTTSNGASGVTSGQTLYVRRAFMYLAADQAGLLRLGQTDSISGIFDNGVTTFQNFDTGGWNGDPNALPSNVQVSFPFFSQQGADYGYQKFVYLSPQFAGFDLGLQYAPNTGNGAYSCAYAGVVSSTAGTCPALSSSATLGDGARPTNQYSAGARYQGTFGPVGLYAWGTYTGSGTVNYTGPAPAVLRNGTYNGKFDNQSVGFGGAALTIAGVTFGGAYQGGQYNGLGAAQPQNGVKGRAWIAGVQYAAGPLVAGVSFFNYQSQGAVALTNISQRNENGLDVGGTYNIAPGLWGFAQYLYGTRHQGDYNFVTAEPGSAANNSITAQQFMLGTKVRW